MESLKTTKIEKDFEELVTKLAQEELLNLPRGIYHLSQAMKNRGEENSNYNFLPENSILRALMTQQNLDILLNLDSRPLPPFDWRLFPAKNNSKLLQICAKQSQNSISAKSILENFLQNSSICEIALDLMPQILHFYKSVNFQFLKTHIVESLILWWQSAQRDENCLKSLKKLMKNYVKIVSDQDFTEDKTEFVNAIFKLRVCFNHCLDMRGSLQQFAVVFGSL